MKLFIEKKWLLVTVAATLLLSGCSSVEQSIQEIIDTSVETLNTKKTEQQPIPAEFIRHVDGDTTVLRIDGKEQKVRFLLVDTPETVKPKTKVQPYGLEASKRTKELLSTASEIFFEYDKGDRVDRYRRALGALVNTAIGTTIRNVHVVNSSIESLSEKPQVGGIVGTGESINIFDSSVQSSKVSGAYVGGIIGRSLGSTIVNVYTTGEVLNSKDSDLRIGGIIGSGISRSFLKNAYTTVAMECFMAMWFMLKRLELTGESYHCHRFIYKSNV